MKIRLILISLIFFSVFLRPCYSAGIDDARFEFHQGNTNYSAGEYEQAIAHYEQVLSMGFESGELYYNLGNAYFKAGFLGKAILNYIRARRLIPNDADLTSNLNYARSRIKGGVIAAQRPFLTRTFLSIADAFSLDRITLISFIIYLFLSVLIILIILLKDLRRPLTYISIPIAVLLLISASIFIMQFNRTAIQQEAVVVVEEAESKFEPADEATTFFSLSEGENIIVVSLKAGWIKIKRLDGKQGWVKKADIERV